LLEILDNGLNDIITGDETWFHFYTVPSKESNKTWVRGGENRLQISRTAQNAKKRMFCVFFSIEGVMARIVVPKGQTVNGTFYRTNVLPVVFSKYKELKNRKTVRNVMMHHDNAAPHKSKIVTEYLEKEKIISLPHPPYSPDLAPCDFFLFPRIKKELKNQHFDHIENLARAIQAITDGITKEDYQKSFENWKNRLQKCIDNDGNYFEGMH
jgi:histone-lysine N-methyltransferase SETMAR